ncbi:MAG: DUF2752 domain-containing protein [Planctomycetota bacterium]
MRKFAGFCGPRIVSLASEGDRGGLFKFVVDLSLRSQSKIVDESPTDGPENRPFSRKDGPENRLAAQVQDKLNGSVQKGDQAQGGETQPQRKQKTAPAVTNGGAEAQQENRLLLKYQRSGAYARLDSFLWFGGVALMLLATLILDVRAEGRVGIAGTEFLLPESCMMKSRFQVECPGCGLTRSMIHIANGRFSAAWGLNWVSFVVFVYSLIQLPISLLHAFLAPESKAASRLYQIAIWVNERAMVVVIVLLATRWLLNLI